MFKQTFELLRDYIPLLVSLAFASGLLYVANRLLLRGKKLLSQESRLARQGVIIILAVLSTVFVLLSVPMPTETRGQLLSLLGILLTGVIAFSSSSFIANIMAGLMLRFIRSFRPGDFLRVNDQFGRVTEIGLMHTEIQTEDRTLVTFPNLYLTTNPVKVVRASGTIVSATLSLGYDLEHSQIEELLKEAARKTGLEEPFVRVSDLGDFSVTYRIAGMLKEVKLLLTTRSNLRKNVLDVLHEAGVEIVSPNFMNQRQLPPDKMFVPRHHSKKQTKKTREEESPENIIFDKADEAESKINLKKKYEEISARVQEKKKELKSVEKEDKIRLEREIVKLNHQLEVLEKKIGVAAEKEDG